jgi:2-polyprenyl-6-methoxyphenol hydroxylase-like FAD-dependent oxidoreductase
MLNTRRAGNRMRASVIGCGIAGASAALALAEIGCAVEVDEAAPQFTDHQGWVTLGPSAMTGLDRLGVAEQVWAVGFPVVSVHTVDTITGDVTDFPRYEATHRYPSTHVWRRDLLSIVRNRLDEVGVTCRYGSTASVGDLDADLIVGADGAWSATRRAIGNCTEPGYTGQIIRYGHHPRPAPGLPTGVLHFWRHHNGVVGYVADARDGSFWFSRYNSDSPSLRVDLHTMTAALRDTPVREILDASCWASNPIALYELDPNGRWHRDHTVLIGDAAHALSPAAGRGATSAIEDAVILARHLREHAYRVGEALESFTTNRRPIALATYQPTHGQRPATISAHELNLTAGRSQGQ